MTLEGNLETITSSSSWKKTGAHWTVPFTHSWTYKVALWIKFQLFSPPIQWRLGQDLPIGSGCPPPAAHTSPRWLSGPRKEKKAGSIIHQAEVPQASGGKCWGRQNNHFSICVQRPSFIGFEAVFREMGSLWVEYMLRKLSTMAPWKSTKKSEGLR